MKSHGAQEYGVHRTYTEMAAVSYGIIHASACMWLCMKSHGAQEYGVHRTYTEMAAVSYGIIHASAISTPFQWIFKNAL